MLNSALIQRFAQCGFRAWNFCFARYSVKSERLVLPILMQSSFQVATALVSGKAERFRFLGLVDREHNKFNVRSHYSTRLGFALSGIRDLCVPDSTKLVLQLSEAGH